MFLFILIFFQVQNSLGAEVKVSQISLLSEEADLEMTGSGNTVILAATADKQTVIVRAIPRAVGNLRNNVGQLIVLLDGIFSFGASL